MWAAIIAAVLGVVGDIITNIFTNEQKVQAELKAKTYEEKMNSFVRSNKIEKDIAKTEPTTPVTTPSDWNAGVGRVAPLLFLLLSLLILSGCVRYVYVNDRKPMIEIPARPEIPTVPEFTDREKQIVGYTQTLEARIQKYNEWVESENIKNGYTQPEEEGTGESSEEPNSEEAPADGETPR